MIKRLGLALAFIVWASVAHAQFFPFPGPGRSGSGGGGGFSLTAQGSAGSATTGTTSINYGTISYGSGCNAVIAMVFWYNTAAVDTVTALTIGGNATTAVTNTFAAVSGGGSSVTMRQWSAPSGTSGAVVVTYSGNVTYNSNVTLYCLISSNTTVQSSNAQGFSCTTGAPIATTGLTVPTGGVAIAATATTGGAVMTFTNATNDATYTGGGVYNLWGHTTATGAFNITATPTGSDGCVLSAAAWGP